MAIKQASHSFRGMRKDISPSKASPEYIIDALNIRLTPNGRDSLFSVTCERYPELKISIPAEEIWSSINNIKIEYQHYCIINNFLILFLIIEGVAGKNTFVYNTILKIDLSDITALDTDYSKYILFSGWKNKNTEETYNYLNLNSSIDSLASYENDEIQKIYWVDGINQPRVINIAANEEIRSKWNEKSFDFIKELNLQEVFKVEKLYQYGMFAPGVIQYCYTYFNKNGGETNIVDISPLLYISEQNKGTSPEKFVTDNCFKINIGNADASFDYIRVYSIHRTSLDAIPEVKVVKDIEVKPSILENTIIDNGMVGYPIDPSELLYKGGEYIIPKTIAQKDGVLFLGNIALNNKESTINTKIDDYINNSEGSIYSLEWVRTPLNVNVDTNSLYPYTELQNAEDSFRTFKFRETYRIGIQCQTNTGKWLNPIYIEDSKVNTSPYFKYNESIEVVNGKLTINQNLISKLHDLGVKKIRPIIVYPTDINREIIAQGILNPTVFNTKQKYENSCDAQCSWLFRPLTSNITAESVSYPDQNLDKVTDKTIDIDNNVYKSKSNTFASRGGYWPESKHYYLLPPNYSPLAELPHMQYTLVLGEENEVLTPVSGNVNVLGRMSGNNNSIGSKDVDYYAVDRNIVTLHSPELEKKKITNTDGYKLRYVGYITCDRCNKGFNVQYSNDKVYKSDDPNNNTSDTSLVFLEGAFTKYNGDFEDFINTNAEGTSTVKPWWYNYIFSSTEFPEKESEIKKQTVSNNIISNTTKYFDKIYLGETSDIKLFDGDVSSLVLKSSDNAFWSNGKRDFIYKGNVNDILTAFRTEAMPLNLEGMINFASTGESTINAWPAVLNVHSTSYLYTAKYGYSFTNNIGKTYAKNKNNNFLYGTKSPVLMKYNSTPHVVIALDNNEGYKYTLPIISTSENKGNLETYNKHTQELPDWDGTKSKIIPQWVIEDNDISTKRYLVLAELYREVTNKFGDVENNDTNLWYPAGPSISINNNTDNILSISYGDTFFSRYDCLKTYPYNEDSVFNVVDIATFFVETRINTDLRYDNNKGNISNIYARPQNFNLFNDAYNQLDNFFNYRNQEEDILDNINFPTTITWSKQKIYGELIDTWSNITMASTQDLEGIDGELIKIYNFKNELFCFQPKAFNHVLYNSRIQVNSSDGVPIEIANSGRVQGFRKIANVGIPNLRSVNDNNSYLYFADNITKSIYKYDGSLVSSLTDQLNFSTWAKYNIQDNFEIYVDNTNKNIYFNNPEEGKNILGYSETLQEFESFYSYTEPIIKGNNNSFILSCSDTAIKLYSLYSNIKPEYDVSSMPTNVYPLDNSYISVITNNSSSTNKCFTGIEFKADSMDINNPDWEDSKSDTLPFTRIKVEDSHLNKEETLVYNKYRPSNTKKKFNTWRIEFPRVLKDGKYLRFNNPWVKTTLTFNRSDNYLGQEIHDLNVTFIE